MTLNWSATESARCVDGSFVACAFRDDGKRVDAKRITLGAALGAVEGRKHDA